MGAHRLQWRCGTKHRTNSYLLGQRKFDQRGTERHPQLANHERHFGYDYRHGWQCDADCNLYVPGLRQCE